jgi:hypothetical protein
MPSAQSFFTFSNMQIPKRYQLSENPLEVKQIYNNEIRNLFGSMQFQSAPTEDQKREMIGNLIFDFIAHIINKYAFIIITLIFI